MAAPATVGGEPHPTYATGETWEGRMWAMTREPVYLPLTRYRKSVRRGVRAQSTRSNLANRGEKNGVSGETTFVGSVDMFFSKSFLQNFAIAFLVFSIFGFNIGPAEAHHPMDFQTPQTVLQGLLSGFGHPIIGFDHLAFVVGLGFISALFPSGLAALSSFIVGCLVGCIIHINSLDLPLVEPIIASSVILAGVIIAFRYALSKYVFGPAIAIFGVFHGYAYGEAIIGAEGSVLGAYLMGLSLVQFCIGALVYCGFRFLGPKFSRTDFGARMAGMTIGGFGAATLFGQVIS